MSYDVYYSRQAEKFLLKTTKSKAVTILTRIKKISQKPFSTDNNISKLTGTKSGYRLRLGDIRIVYELDTEKEKMYVVKIAPRGSVYLL